MGNDCTALAPLSLQRQLALRCAAIVLLTGLLASSALLVALTHYNHQQAQAGLQAITHSVAQTIANQMARAVRLGIPVSQVPGVQAHLEQTLANTPEVAYLAITDVQGAPMHAVSRGAVMQLQSLPITVKNQTVATVVAGSLHQQTHGLFKPALVCISIVLLVAVLVGGAIYGGPARRLQRRHALFLESLHRGTPLTQESPEVTDALQHAMQTLAALQYRNQQARQALRDYAAEIRAVEFDSKTLAAIDAIELVAIKTGNQA